LITIEDSGACDDAFAVNIVIPVTAGAIGFYVVGVVFLCANEDTFKKVIVDLYSLLVPEGS
jgi:hypothetical protein